jgi:lipopolysaccharide/colanic/teichoic acid biosynthesis glycosyltransferase
VEAGDPVHEAAFALNAGWQKITVRTISSDQVYNAFIPTVFLKLLERVLGGALFLLAGPTIFVTYCALYCFTTGPVVITDRMPTNDGRIIKSLRFRTTGAGTSAFHHVGRWLRKFGLDELPVLWSLARGDVRLRDIFPNSVDFR